MSLQVPSQDTDRVSKVTFFPASDATGENKVLIVNIKSVAPGMEDIAKMEQSKKSASADNKKRTRLSRSFSEKSVTKSANKSTMTDAPLEVPGTSLQGMSSPEATVQAQTDSGPCLKHAAQNISRKASRIPSEKISLCNNCSKSMLSYIFLVQDFLDSLATEICGVADSKSCPQCLRQESRLAASVETISKDDKKSSKSRTRSESSKSVESSKTAEHSRTVRPTHLPGLERETRRYEETSEQQIQRSLHLHQERSQGVQSHEISQDKQQIVQPSHEEFGNQSTSTGFSSSVLHRHLDDTQSVQQSGNDSSTVVLPNVNSNAPLADAHQRTSTDVSVPESGDIQRVPFLKLMERHQPAMNVIGDDHRGFHSVEEASSPFSDKVDYMMTTLSNVEREVYDSARNTAGRDTLSEWQEKLVSSATGQIPSEAFVTMCRNNAEALGCLVVGTSLLLSRTTRTLCVLVSDGVTNAFRGPLSSVFHVVQCVRSLDSLGTTKLSLLEQPELGISFEKLNVWRLTQFNKCVFLNPDTLVIQNCDDLFCHEELSAVADIGWPDCFNSGVFVFVPSQKTFWQLLEFAEKQGSYDGGDQGLLNAYFNDWSSDLNKKLFFTYNLMANVSYTYTPAFRQFGRDVKIVQFHGSFKPWHVKFYSRSGQLSPASSVHPTYVQFVHIWINIFRISALRQLSRDVQSYALSQEVLCAVELLRFFPLPTESEAEFFLTPPSVRLRLAERKMQGNAKPFAEEAKRRKSAEFSRHTVAEDDVFETPLKDPELKSTETSEEAVDSEKNGAAVKEENVAKKSLLPGSEIGDYQGMKAWEQGRMDYQGTDSSENIIKRLEFLMSQPK